MSNNYWTSPDDFAKDMLMVSDFCDGSFEREKYKPSVHTRKARSKPQLGPSIYDEPQDEEEEEGESPPRFRGRGRGFPLATAGGTGPGGVPSFLERQYQTTMEIRELCEVGFSNDVIESSLKSDCDEQRNHTSEAKFSMPNIRLTSSPKSNSSSKYSTPSASPLPRSNEKSPVDSPNSIRKPKGAFDSNVVQRSVYKQGTASSKNTAPPIYDILQLPKGKSVEKSNNKTKAVNGFCKPVVGKPEINELCFFKPIETKMYDIKSKVDFPQLP